MGYHENWGNRWGQGWGTPTSKNLNRSGASPNQGVWGLQNQPDYGMTMGNFNKLGLEKGGYKKQKEWLDWVESQGGGRGALGTPRGVPTMQSSPMNQSGYKEQLGTGVFTREDDRARRKVATQLDRQDSFADDMIDFQYDLGSIGGDASWKNQRMRDEEKATEGLGGNWYDNIGKDIYSGIKGLGWKGAFDLGIRGMEVYGGFKKREQAEKQHALASDVFAFQKQAYEKDLVGRTTDYNQKISDINAWKAAQGRTDMGKLMPTTVQV